MQVDMALRVNSSLELRQIGGVIAGRRRRRGTSICHLLGKLRSLSCTDYDDI